MKTAIVTGAAGGIGRSIALKLATVGWSVVAVDISDKVADISGTICEKGGNAVSLQADLTQEADWESIFATAEKAFSPVGALVNNAGISGPYMAIDSYPVDQFDQLMSVNVRSVFLGLQHGLRRMREHGEGAVVNIGSTSSIRGRGGLAGYVASKHAVLGLTRVASVDMNGTGVRVNAILPGPVETPMIHNINENAAAQGQIIQRHGTNPPISPESVSDVVAFLISPQAKHVNGAAWVVDDGSTVI